MEKGEKAGRTKVRTHIDTEAIVCRVIFAVYILSIIIYLKKEKEVLNGLILKMNCYVGG